MLFCDVLLSCVSLNKVLGSVCAGSHPVYSGSAGLGSLKVSGQQFVASIMADVKSSDRPTWTGKFVLSWISRMRSYCDEVVRTGIKSKKSADTGGAIEEYEVSAALVFDHTKSSQKAVSNEEYKKISNKVYNRLNYSFKESETLMASVAEGDGRAAVEKIIGTLGSEQHQLGALDGELKNNLKALQSREQFASFENTFGRIVKEWRLVIKRSNDDDIKEQKQSEGALRRYVMTAIQEVFPDVWRDAMKLGNTDTYFTILKNCTNINMALGGGSVRPTTHLNQVPSGGYREENRHGNPRSYESWGGKGTGYPKGGKGGYGKGKGGKGSGHNTWDFNKNDWRRCDNCNATDHYRRFCAKPGGPFEGRLQEAIVAKRAEVESRSYGREKGGKGKGSYGKGNYGGKGYYSGYNDSGYQSQFNRNDYYRDQSGNDFSEQHGASVFNSPQAVNQAAVQAQAFLSSLQSNGIEYQTVNQAGEVSGSNQARAPINSPSIWALRAMGTGSNGGGVHRSYPSVVLSAVGSNGGGVVLSARHALNLAAMASNNGMDGFCDYACVDSGCNEFAVFNNMAYFPFEYSVDHSVDMWVADTHKIHLDGIGTAYMVLFDEISGQEFIISLERSAQDKRYQMILIPEGHFHFEKDGVTERNNFINFKKNAMLLDQGEEDEKYVVVNRIEKLPCLKIRPLNTSEILKIRISKGSFDMTTVAKTYGFRMSKKTWLDAHKSLGCPGDRYLKTMAQHDMIKGLKELLPFPKEGVKIFCDCHVNKAVMMKHMIPDVSMRVMAPGTVEVSQDIFGPWPVRSIHGEVYANVFKIKGKRHITFIPMKSKDDVIKVSDQYLLDMSLHAKEVGAMVVNVDLISGDSDSNYLSAAMREWCLKKNIRQFSSAPSSHSHNSNECIMKLIKEGILNYLFLTGFPQMLWTFGGGWAAFTLNRQFTESCSDEKEKFVVPHLRVFSGDEVDLDMMLPIGCKIFVYIDADTLAMNGDHSYIAYFCGYPYNMKGFQVYAPTRRAVYEVFHIKANTRIFYKDEWGPQKKLMREVNKEIVLMSKEDVFAFDQMEDGELKDFSREFKFTEEGRLEAKDHFVQDTQVPLREFDRELQTALEPISETPFKVDTESHDKVNQMYQTPGLKQSRVAANLFDDVISPDAEPVRKSRRIEERDNPIGPSGFTGDQARNILKGVKTNSVRMVVNGSRDGFDDEEADKSAFKALSNSSLLMTMTALTMAIGGAMSYPNKVALAEADVSASMNMALSALSAKSLFDVETYENPNSIEEAFARPGKEGAMWYEQAVGEMDYLFDNVIKPKRRSDFINPHVLKAGWNCVAKWDGEGNLKKVRPRAFPKGYAQIPYKEFDPWKIASYTARKESIMTCLFLLVKFSYNIYLYDIVKAFFSESLKETVLSEVPPGFKDHPKYSPYGKDTVWLYIMNAYGLRQASHDFGEGYAQTFVSKGWKRLLSDVNVFIKRVGLLVCIFSLWVDDNFVIFSSPEAHYLFEEVLLNSKYQYTRDVFDYALGLNVSYNLAKRELALSTTNFCSRFFKMHKLEKINVKSIPLPTGSNVSRKDCPAVDKPDPVLYSRFRSILGGIAHAANWVHKEMLLAVGMLSRVMINPSQVHMDLLIHLAGYLKGVANKPLLMKGNSRLFPGEKIKLWGYCDADYAGCVDTGRSTSGYSIFGDGNLLSCYSGLQPTVALSTTQAEWGALVSIVTMIMWFLNLFSELGFEVELPVLILCDNQSCIYVAKGAAQNFKRVKHFDIKDLFLKEIIKKGDIDVVYVRTEGNVSDMLTKCLPKGKFLKFRDLLLGDVLPVPEDKSQWSKTLREIYEIEDQS